MAELAGIPCALALHEERAQLAVLLLDVLLDHFYVFAFKVTLITLFWVLHVDVLLQHFCCVEHLFTHWALKLRFLILSLLGGLGRRRRSSWLPPVDLYALLKLRHGVEPRITLDAPEVSTPVHRQQEVLGK